MRSFVAEGECHEEISWKRVAQVMENLRVKKDVNQLAALLEMFQCLIDNKHFAFMEIYVSE